MKKISKVLAKLVAKIYISISNLKKKPRRQIKFNPLIAVGLCALIVVGFAIAGILSVHRQYKPEVSAESSQSNPSQTGTQLDGVNIIGNSYSECEEIFGKSEGVVQDNIRKYKLIGATILFDKKTNEAISVGIDEKDTTERCTVYGLYLGESIDEATKALAEKDIELLLDGEGSFSTVFEYKGRRFKLFLNSENGEITWVRVTLVG